MPNQRPGLFYPIVPMFAMSLVGFARPTIGLAQPAPSPELESVTVIGTRLNNDFAQAASATTVIDAAAIELRNKASVPDLLADVAGLHTNQPGGRGSVGEIFLRGGEPNFTAVLVDGVQMNDPTNTRGGSFDFSTLDISEIQAIEINRGALSSVYGSDALSGVINIVTHRPRDRTEGHAVLALGSEQFASASARLGGPLSSSSRYIVSAGTRRDGHADADAGSRSTQLSGSVEFLADREASLIISGRSSDVDLHAFPDSSGGASLAVIRDQDRRRLRDDTLDLSWHRPVTSRSELRVTATALEHTEELVSPGVASGVSDGIPPNRSRAEFSRETLTMYVQSNFAERLSTAVGFNVERQQGSSNGFVTFAPGIDVPTGYDLSRRTVAAFGELGYDLTRSLVLSASLRVDDNDTADRETTSKIGLSYALANANARLRLAWARGFKLPSLFSLGDSLVGNPNLRAETVDGFEIGIDYRDPRDRLQLDVTFFAQRFENLIDFDFEQFMSVNRDAVDADGAELGAHYRLSESVALVVNGTWVSLDVVDSPQELRQRPKRRGGIGLEWQPGPALTVFAGLRHVGERLDASIPTGERRLAAYSKLDASLSWRVNENHTVQMAVDNLTDERYEDAIGFPSLGARVRLSWHARLL